MLDTTSSDYSTASSIDHTNIKNPSLLLLMRASWWLLIALSSVVVVFALQARYETVLADSIEHADIYAAMGISLEFPSIYFVAAQIIAIIVVTICGFLLFLRRSNSWLLYLMSVALIANGISSNDLIIHLYSYNPEWKWFVFVLMNIYVNAYTIAVFLFPDGQLFPRRSRWYLLISPLMWSVLLWYFFDPNISASTYDVILAVLVILALSVGTFGILSIYRRFHQSSSGIRQQIKWLVVGVFVWFITYVAYLLAGLVLMPYFADRMPQLERLLWLIFYPLPNWGSSILAVLILFSISRYRLYDIDFILNRSLVSAGVLLVLAAAFVASAILIQSLLGAENALVAWGVSIAIPALLFNPVQKRVRRFIDRRIYGLRFDMNEVRAVHRERPITNPGQHTGKTLGDYEILDVLGKGGMGEVYKGFGNAQTVAIKILQMGTLHSEDLLTRFIREAQTGMTLDHRNIAKVYDVGEQDGVHYIIMEYIEGHDLAEQLDKTGLLDIETTTQIMQDICTGLEAAHSAGFVHRDIKPGNVMLRENGEAVVMDFGVTKSLDSHTSLTGTTMVGTPHYMAPEQIKSDKELDHRADIYSLGVMLYEMLTGDKPFSGSLIQVVFSHMNQPAPDVRDVNEDIPREIAKAIQKAMAKNPDERFASVNEFAEALR